MVEKLIVADMSPVSMPADFGGMDRIFVAMKNLQVPKNLSMGNGRKYAEEEMLKTINSRSTVDFMLMNLRKSPEGRYSLRRYCENCEQILNISHLIITVFIGHTMLSVYIEITYYYKSFVNISVSFRHSLVRQYLFAANNQTLWSKWMQFFTYKAF